MEKLDLEKREIIRYKDKKFRFLGIEARISSGISVEYQKNNGEIGSIIADEENFYVLLEPKGSTSGFGTSKIKWEDFIEDAEFEK